MVCRTIQNDPEIVVLTKPDPCYHKWNPGVTYVGSAVVTPPWPCNPFKRPSPGKQAELDEERVSEPFN
jgi:hypothetical protein